MPVGVCVARRNTTWASSKVVPMTQTASEEGGWRRLDGEQAVRQL